MEPILYFKVQKRNFVEYVRVVFNYYRKFIFAKVDFTLLLLYLFQNPFRIAKKFLLQRGEKEVYLYGETPLTTMDQIAIDCAIKKQDKVFELGCGRGRCCFWLNAFVGCDVVGIEYVPLFIERANKIIKLFDIQCLEFRDANMLETNFEGATFFYLYGTCYDTEFIEKLIEKFQKCPAGTRIVTVSYALNDYCDNTIFTLVKQFSAQFTWGQADVYLQILN